MDTIPAAPVHHARSLRHSLRASAPGCTCSLDWPDGTEGETKTDEVVPDVGLVPVAVPRPAVRGVVDPTAAPEHPERALGRPDWISRVIAAVRLVPVAAPFPDISVHVEQPPAVWQLAPTR